MRSFLALLAVFAVLIVVACSSVESEPPECRERVPDYSLDDLQAIAERQEKLEAQRFHGNQFRRVLQEVLARLMAGEITLNEAVDLVLPSAEQYPAWEQGLHRTEPAHLSRRGRVASNLLRHYGIALEVGAVSPDRHSHLEALQRELATWDTSSQPTQDSVELR